MMKKQFHLLTFFVLSILNCYAQQPYTEPSYPKVVGYASFMHPIVTFSEDATVFNFDKNYTVAFPCGINILKSDKIGFSFEIAPFIKTENGVSKVSTFLFHPGLMFRFKQGFTIIARAAFETSGRFGVTPVFNKIFCKKKNHNYFVAVPLPLRFGNDKPVSATIGLQIGIGF